MKLIRLAIVLLLSTGLVACGNGITDTQVDSGLSADGGGDTSDPGDTVGDGQHAAFESLDFSYADNSVVNLLFRARDQRGEPLDTLALADLQILEDGAPLDVAESLQALLPKASLPYVLQTAIVMDISASIDFQELALMTAAVRGLIASSDSSTGLLARQRVALYTFDSSVRRVVSFTDDEKVLGLALDSVRTSGTLSTDLYGAVQYVANDINNRYSTNSIVEGAIILITDGRDTANRVSEAQALAAAEGVAVFTVGVGQDADANALYALGSEGSESAANYDALYQALQAIQLRLERWLGSLYNLNYASPKRRAAGAIGNSEHEFQLRVDNNSNAEGDSNKITHTFNAYNFNEVRATVNISGPRTINVGQTESYVADTRWGGQTASIYSWSISGEGCTLKASAGATARVQAVQAGGCQLLAVDTAHSTSTTLIIEAENVRLDP